MIQLAGSLNSLRSSLSRETLSAWLWPQAEPFYRSWRLAFLDLVEQGWIVASDRSDGERLTEDAGLKVALYMVISTQELESIWQNLFSSPRPGKPLGSYLLAEGKVQMKDIDQAMVIQGHSGDRIGEILLAEGAIRPLDLAEVVAKQHQLPFYDLSAVRLSPRPGQTYLDPSLLKLLEPSFMQRNLVLPIGHLGDSLVLAMEDPTRVDVVNEVARILGAPVVPVATGRRDVLRLLEEGLGSEYLDTSKEELHRSRPDESSAQVLSGPQTLIFGLLLLTLIGLSIRWPWPVLIVLNAISTLFYLAFSVTKFILVNNSLDHQLEVPVTQEELENLDWSTLPVYTVLVPAYREANILPNLIAALKRLEYPKPRLDVKLLLEGNDLESIEVARSCGLPPFIDLVVLPHGEPKTKPKALNYGLLHARGEYLVIFDAEDIPDADQLLKAVVAFAKVPAGIACLQAKLNYYNQNQNLLTKWFTSEYSMWFDLLLPALDKAKMPIPLGGTSNHFRTSVLRQISAWDPYNVTEDADLGIRLHRHGHQVAILDSTTWEESNSRLNNWVRQRSRWVKGYMQTWLVHMRHPVRFLREIGFKDFWGFQMIVGGTFWGFLLNPIYWWITTLWFFTHAGWIPQLFPSWVYYVGMFNLFIGNFVFTYGNMAGAMRRDAFSLVRVAALSPFYWALMSIAAWKALWQLISRPFFWEKTEHGFLEHPVSLSGGPVNLSANQ